VNFAILRAGVVVGVASVGTAFAQPPATGRLLVTVVD
jgi:hypothetical protein